jgi:hypothetical protein
MLLVLVGLASVTTGCRVEGEVGESSHIPSVNVSSNVM